MAQNKLYLRNTHPREIKVYYCLTFRLINQSLCSNTYFISKICCIMFHKCTKSQILQQNINRTTTKIFIKQNT